MQCFYFIHVGTEMEKKWRIAVAFWKLMHGAILPVTPPPPPKQPRGQVQVQPFEPGGGELFEVVLSRGRGAGQIENNFLLFL